MCYASGHAYYLPAAFPLFNVCPVYSGDSGGSLVSMKSSWEEIMVNKLCLLYIRIMNNIIGISMSSDAIQHHI